MEWGISKAVLPFRIEWSGKVQSVDIWAETKKKSEWTMQIFEGRVVWAEGTASIKLWGMLGISEIREWTVWGGVLIMAGFVGHRRVSSFIPSEMESPKKDLEQKRYTVF